MSNNTSTISIEEAQNAIQTILTFGKQNGIDKILDRYKWREFFTADILKQNVFKKASNDTQSHGADARNDLGKLCEYKSKTLSDRQYQVIFGNRKAKKLIVAGVYNGAYSDEIIESYRKIDHYIALFYKETPVLIYKVDTDFVVTQLKEGLKKKEEARKLGKKVSTNLNSVVFDYIKHDTNVIKEVYRKAL